MLCVPRHVLTTALVTCLLKGTPKTIRKQKDTRKRWVCFCFCLRKYMVFRFYLETLLSDRLNLQLSQSGMRASQVQPMHRRASTSGSHWGCRKQSKIKCIGPVFGGLVKTYTSGFGICPYTERIHSSHRLGYTYSTKTVVHRPTRLLGINCKHASLGICFGFPNPSKNPRREANP